MKQVPKVHEVVAISSGLHKGMAGVVVETKEGNSRVQIDGVRDDVPLSKLLWFKNSALEVVA